MDAKARPEKPIDEAIKALKIDPPSKASSITMSGGKGASLSDATSCISSGDATSSIKEIEVDQDVSVVDEGTYYYGYYYPGSHGVMGEWDNSFCNRGTDNVRVEHPVSTIQTDSGSLIYYLPGFQTGYSNYGPFSPGPMYCADGQFWGQGSYYPSPVSPQTVVSPGFYAHPIAYGPELIPAYPWDPYFFFQDEIQGNTFTVDPTNSHYKPNHSSNVHNLPPSKTLTISKATSLASDLSRPVSAQNQTQKSVKKAPTAVLPQGYVPLNKLSGYANQVSGALLYPNSAMPMKENRRCWDDDEKLKARNKLNGLADLDLLNEQNRGPRTTSIKTTTHSGDNLQETLSIKQNDNCSGSIDRDEYNSPDFITMYEQALFFVIKSYSEDDVHKSIKYNVWSSTPNGNKRLDNAFQAAQGKLAEKGGKCPVFLFFSVNASGQFCGVAEMTGRVDFSKNMSFWQQDKWNGFFPVKWHIIKDVPNPRLRHIILENNENKPVTNSRDTQEVKFPQGTEMLNIFKSYSAKTSILDDFGFYENRQKAMQEKRSKPTTPTLDNSLPPKMVESSPFQKLDDSKSHKLVLVEVKEALPCSTVTSPK